MASLEWGDDCGVEPARAAELISRFFSWMTGNIILEISNFFHEISIKMVKIQICIKMIVMVLFHHHSSIYNEDWSKPAYGRVCSNPRYIYY